MGVTPEQFRQLEERVAGNRHKPLAPVTPMPPSAVGRDTSNLIFASLDRYSSNEFVFNGKPLGKPRMTRRDKFKQRPCVMRYRAFADGLRAAAGNLPEGADMVIVTAWVPMPPSWSKNKKDQMLGQPCRQKPDWDNIGKAVCDALFDEDACIWVGVTIKYWCLAGQERLNVKVLYAKS